MQVDDAERIIVELTEDTSQVSTLLPVLGTKDLFLVLQKVTESGLESCTADELSYLLLQLSKLHDVEAILSSGIVREVILAYRKVRS